MTNNYSADEATKIKDSFDFFDKDGDGFINKIEAENALISLGEEITPKIKDKIEAKYDYDSFIALCSSIGVDISKLESKIIDAFKLFEFEKKGSVSASNIENLLLNDKVSTKEIEQLIREANPENGFIDYIQFTDELLRSVAPVETTNSNVNATETEN